MSYKCRICKDCPSSDEDSEIEYPSSLTDSDSEVEPAHAHADYESENESERENPLEDSSEESEEENQGRNNKGPEGRMMAAHSVRLRRRRRHINHDKHKPRRVRRTYVKMATGKRFPITVPKVRGWKCGMKTKFITLRPNGKMGRREYTIVDKEMKKTLGQHIRCAQGGGCFTKYWILKVQKLINGCLWKRYRSRLREVAREAGFANERMLFHGTTAENTKDIVMTGFDERHAHLNGMFGAGIYFAKHSSKANQYVFGYMGGKGCPKHGNKSCYVCPRKLLLCRVVLGKQARYLTEHIMAHPPPHYHSVLGVPSKTGLYFPEYVVYRGEQVYPEFLVTYKIVP